MFKGSNAHVPFYERFVAPISKGFYLDHLCRVRSCVNPEHMEPVLPSVNTQRGGTATLSAELVREARDRYRAENITYQQLADEYNVALSTIYEAINKRTWSNIT